MSQYSEWGIYSDIAQSFCDSFSFPEVSAPNVKICRTNSASGAMLSMWTSLLKIVNAPDICSLDVQWCLFYFILSLLVVGDCSDETSLDYFILDHLVPYEFNVNLSFMPEIECNN